MPGPFPGMDPYLEHHWQDVHARLVLYSADQLQPKLPEGLVARVEETISLGEDPSTGGGNGRPRRARPDGRIQEEPGAARPAGGGAAMLAPAPRASHQVFRTPATRTVRRRMLIRELDPPRLVTTLEVLSPENKTARGRRDFREKQRTLAARGVNLVEIDLLRRGRWAVFPSESGVPAEFREPYRLVSTIGGSGASELARAPLRAPLPTITVPLRDPEEDVTLEIQPLVETAWVNGAYRSLDYAGLEPPPFDPDDAAWVADRVREWTERRGPAGGG